MNISPRFLQFLHPESFLVLLILLPPLWVSFFITPVWWWLFFSVFYVLSFIVVVKFNRYMGRAIALLLSVLPFMSFNILLFVNYYLQGSGFNEAFYYHFNKQGIYGHEEKVIILGVLSVLYFFTVCFFTFRLKYLQGRLRLRVTGICFVILIALLSPQTLSFAGMYLNAHDNNLVSRYIQSDTDKEDPVLNDLIEQTRNDFVYSVRVKKNLVFIYAESLERSFLDKELFPGDLCLLDAADSSSIDFSDMVQTAYTGWTIAGMVSSLCGYPLQMPLDSSSHNFNLYDEFMPDAECISDLLADEEYTLSFWGGADLEFAGKKAFLSTHSFENIRGKKKFLTQYPEGDEYYNRWGLRDRPLFANAYKEFLELSSKDQPFGMFLLTLDTHAPGFPDPACSERYKDVQDNRMLDAVRCSSKIIGDFIKKIRASHYSEDTVIVILSDHLAHGSPAGQYLKDQVRKLTFMVDLPAGHFVDVPKTGTHYDVGPTVLAAVGIDSSQAFGFGRSMLNFLPEGDTFVARTGLLPERLGRDGLKSFARQNVVKSLVREKWGDYLGAIDEEGIRINDANYTISFGGKDFSFRHPTPQKLSKAGALFFHLDHNGYRVRDIFSLNDYVRLPGNFSIKHWLRKENGFYLYVGSRQGIPFLGMKGNSSDTVLAFIDLQNGLERVIPIHGPLEFSLKEIDSMLHSENFFGHSIQVRPDSSLLADEIIGVSVLSCLDEICQSHIEDVHHKSHRASWGLSVWQLSHSGKVQLLEHIDHCGDRQSFKLSGGLDPLVQKAKASDQAAVVLVGHNSVFCEPKEDLLRWLEPYDLVRLQNIHFKQPYVGIINLDTDEVEEFTGEDMVQVEF